MPDRNCNTGYFHCCATCTCAFFVSRRETSLQARPCQSQTKVTYPRCTSIFSEISLRSRLDCGKLPVARIPVRAPPFSPLYRWRFVLIFLCFFLFLPPRFLALACLSRDWQDLLNVGAMEVEMICRCFFFFFLAECSGLLFFFFGQIWTSFIFDFIHLAVLIIEENLRIESSQQVQEIIVYKIRRLKFEEFFSSLIIIYNNNTRVLQYVS